MGDDKTARDALRPLVHNGLLRLTGGTTDHWEFTHALAHKFAHDGNGDRALSPLSPLCRWAMEHFFAAIAAARDDDLSQLHPALTHAAALLRNDKGDRPATLLSDTLLFEGFDMIWTFARLDFARAALSATYTWVNNALIEKPQNAPLERKLCISYLRLGDLAVATGELTRAHASVLQSFDIVQRLADNEPSNTQLQRDVAASLYRFGNLAAQLGQRQSALDYFEKVRTISAPLCRQDPTNAIWKNDLAVIKAAIARLKS